MPRDQIMFTLLLVGLTLLSLFLVLNDPHLNNPPGHSRVDWPSATPAKP